MNVELISPEWAVELLSDLTDMQRAPQPLAPGGGERIRYELPDDAYFEYAFSDARGEIRPDPANPVRGDNPWFRAVSAVKGPDYRASEFAKLPPELARGETRRLRVRSEALGGEERRMIAYTPSGARQRWLPLLIVQDGVAFYRLAGLHLVGEALLGGGRIRPAHYVFVEPNDRNAEYAFSLAYREFLVEELLPLLDRELPTSGERLWMGASLGGLLSATVAFTRPDAVHGLATLSGAFLGTPEEPEFFESGKSWVLERILAGVQLPARWYLEVGTLEWLTEINRAVAEAIAARGAEHRFVTRSAGHNWTNWRNALAPTLEHLLGA